MPNTTLQCHPLLRLLLMLLVLPVPALAQQQSAAPLITSFETVPAADQWLSPGDRLQVRLVGQPGGRATFLNGQPLWELPPAQAQGRRGVYQGSYLVQPGDTLRGRRLSATLTTPDSLTATALTAQTVQFLEPQQVQLAATRGALAYLNYGLGEDRLGGAKLGYLDSLVTLHVTGRVGDQYRVRLAEARTAWVPEEVVRLLPPGGFVPASLTGSISVQGDSVFDYVRVALSQRLPYQSQLLPEPSRLVVDIFGATSNTNWITQRDGLQELGDVSYEQVQPDVFRLVLHLRHHQSWGYHIGYRGNMLEIRVRRPPQKLRLRGLVVAVDAGHGGDNAGATSASGVREKDLTLAIALKLRQELEQADAQVLMTRTTDQTVDNGDRVLLLRRQLPQVLISIHVNSSANPGMQGTSTYYRYVAFRPLSVALYEEMRGTGLAGWGNVGSFNFALNGPTEYPNALVETAFLSNPDDEKRLTDPEFQQRMAEAMKRGLQQFLKEVKRDERR
ncbi:N-acetylmuramoyl-L-alanine amidase [Hymenobacter weizhouensis]|uniref:N-acetylmuramoyl-L-alanine amidase n=1 Tax=Hymenobacter sp. YIM 151500-1 TaxID=2987689 RepID=UPI0022262521|nr:N-acetylmuramoyl-L-alanine amidase [Hymenobacter sp. YIM 151500-1]UYZ62443.1 N-acetylmuramoyl-L-alanine amidase [Hymenobacter sp. YIM 151500-1]